MDGEQHQLRLVRRYQKQYDFRIVLDFDHVLERLWAAAHELYPEDAWQRTGYVRDRVLKILSGWSSQAASGMRAAATRRQLAEAERSAVDDACDDLIKYRPYLPDGECLDLGLPIATGVVEGTCRSLLIHRMDRSGARWSLGGAEAVPSSALSFRVATSTPTGSSTKTLRSAATMKFSTPTARSLPPRRPPSHPASRN